MAHHGSQEARPLPEPAPAVSTATAAQGAGVLMSFTFIAFSYVFHNFCSGTGLFSQSGKEEAGHSILPALSCAEEAGIRACFLHLEPVKAQGSSPAVVSGPSPV